jgi:hypothetical protein
MKRSHALLLALLLGVAVVAATFAVVTTTSLGMSARAAAPAMPDARIAARTAKLDKTEAALRRALRKKPPALPKLPKRVAPQSRVVHVVSSPPPAEPVSVATSAPTTSQSASDDGGSNYEPGDDGGGHDD